MGFSRNIAYVASSLILSSCSTPSQETHYKQYMANNPPIRYTYSRPIIRESTPSMTNHSSKILPPPTRITIKANPPRREVIPDTSKLEGKCDEDGCENGSCKIPSN